MRRTILALGAGLVLLIPAFVLAQNEVPECITVRGEARWGAGAYNHIVVVRNQCEAAARCDVATNVNPTSTRLDVPAGQSAEIQTFMGSPAREFTPRVTCELER